MLYKYKSTANILVMHANKQLVNSENWTALFAFSTLIITRMFLEQ